MMTKNESDKNGKKQSQSSITRKKFLKRSALSFLSLSSLSTLTSGFHKKDPHIVSRDGDNNNVLRTISYNIFNGAIGHKDINGTELPEEEKYDLLRRARAMGQIPKRMALELALYNPDILSFTESAKESIVAKMAADLDITNYVYFPGGKDGQGGYPGSILTNYEIVSSENRPFVDKENNNPKELFTRHWGKAKIRLPNGEMITVHSVHLWPFRKDKDRNRRLAEIGELLKSIRHDVSHNTESILLQGDLNVTPDTPEYKKLTEGDMVDTFAKVGVGDGATIKSDNPDRRLDYICAIGPITKQISTSRRLFEGNFRINNDDPTSFALSDHLPQLTEFTM